MTEEEWLECIDSIQMLWFLDGTPGGDYIPDNLRVRLQGVTQRKLRLFACGCCRQIWSLLTDGTSRKAVDIAELFADGICDAEEMDGADKLRDNPAMQEYDWAARAAYETLSIDACLAAFSTSNLASQAVQLPAWRRREYACEVKEFASMSVEDRHAILDSPALNAARIAERERQAFLLRDIFGNPFRPVSFLPEWRTSTVLSLAQGIYSDRAFDRMPILADALQDSGCDNEDILNHCRGPGPHCRGCWVCDLCLNES